MFFYSFFFFFVFYVLSGILILSIIYIEYYLVAKMRKNGFQRPWHYYQIISYVIMLIVVVSTCFIIIPLLEAPLSYIFDTIFIILGIIVIVFDCIATAIDPEDKHHYRSDQIPTARCYRCGAKVLITTKHCKECQKCILGFDHHCRWLNNCIGELNYKYFLGLLVSTMIYLLFCMVVGAILFFHYLLHPEAYDQIIEQSIYSSSFNRIAYLVLDGIYFVFLCIPFGYILQLFCFHCELLYLHETTYSYLRKQQQKEAERYKQSLQKVQPKQIPPVTTTTQQTAIPIPTPEVKQVATPSESVGSSYVHRDSSSSSFFLVDMVIKPTQPLNNLNLNPLENTLPAPNSSSTSVDINLVSPNIPTPQPLSEHSSTSV